MDSEEVTLYVSDRLLDRVDDACERSDYADRNAVVRDAIARAAEAAD